MRWLCLLVGAFGLMTSSGIAAPPQPPSYLPRYNVGLTIDPDSRRVDFQVQATWTNPVARPAEQLVLHFYPLFKIPRGDTLLLAKTLELLRLDPSYGIDEVGERGTITSIRLAFDLDLEGRELDWRVRPRNKTAIEIDIPRPIHQNESITILITGRIRLANKQGRWGQWRGVTSLASSLPVFAYYNLDGWQDVPFIPWHQPFWNEAGHYRVNVTVPVEQEVGASAAVAREKPVRPGWKTLEFQPFLGRDFSVFCSRLYRVKEATAKLADGRTVQVRCLAIEAHQSYAAEMAKIAAAAIEQFSQWFGPYPYEQFTIVESYFGWNGNETAGLVMIDERVFDMPRVATGYVEYLVSHETCHQWWFNLVGTNGYAETFIDEGAATYFTHRYLDHKKGKNNPFIEWPNAARIVLPNIGRENYRYSGLYGAIGRGDAPQAAGELPEFGHLANLFSAAYDRGSKVFSQLEARLGEQAFFEFCRGIVAKYSFRQFSAADFKAELIAYTGPQTASIWEDYFERWVYGRGLCDWAIDAVKFERDGPRLKLKPSRLLEQANDPVFVQIDVSQRAENEEPTQIGFTFEEGDGYPVRVPVGANRLQPAADGLMSEVQELGPGRYRVTVSLPRRPRQIMIDPDRMTLDKNPANNRWDRWPRVRVVPVYSMLYETDLTNDYDRWNLTTGPWFYGQTYQDPWYTRTSLIGARLGAYRTQIFNGGVYAAYRPDFRDMVAGVDGILMHWPLNRSEVGFNYEYRFAGPWGDNAGELTAHRANIYARYILQYGSSLYLPPISYVEGYTTYQDNFLPNSRVRSPGAERLQWSWMNGVHFRLNLYTPYWDPERGIWVDLTAAGGVADLANKQVGASQFRGEFAAVRKLPEGFGYLSKIRLAGRLLVQGATPDQGEFFTLGGGTQFRGFDLGERQGSLLWLANAELRLPILTDARLNYFDSFFGIRNVYLAGFYDAGNVYLNGRSTKGPAHALGLGVRADSAIFSFLERATLRFDVAKTVNESSPFQFWFGVQHPF